MSQITPKLKDLVRQEADNLKIHATPEEIADLDFDNLMPEDTHNCIYGQMTGDCFDKRAVELLNLCAIPYSSSNQSWIPCDSEFKTDGRAFSAIEVYITQYNAKNENLIAYLRGETNTLDL